MSVFLTLLPGKREVLQEEFYIDEIYEKVDLESGTLDEDGDDISFVFQPTNLKIGEYNVKITDGPGDLYEVVGTDYFLSFRSNYGYAGYGDEGVLIVTANSYNSKFIKLED